MGWWKSVFVRRAQDWIYAPIDNAQDIPDSKRTRIGPDSAYISVFLKSMRVVNVRSGLSTFYGTVHSWASVPHLSGQVAHFNVITTPSELWNVDAKHIDRVISMEKRLVGPIPYRGGDLELQVGLFSVKSADLADSFLSFLEQAADVAGVAYTSAALPFATLLKEGVNLLLTGSDETILEIGLSRQYATVETGYYVVMRAAKNQVDAKQLRLDPTDYRLLDANGQPVGAYPYMVLHVSAAPNRDDWFQVPELAQAHSTLQDDVRRGQYKKANDSLAAFKRLALTSSDLILAHAQSLVEQVEAQVKAAMGAVPTAKGDQRSIPDLKDVEPVWTRR